VSAPDDLLAAAALTRLEEASASGGDTGLGVAVVVSDVRPDVFAAATIGFASAVPPELAAAWRRTFTRTVFLAGRPETVADRHPPSFAAPDGSLSWHGPAPAGHLLGLSRLLRAFHGPAPVPQPAPFTVTVPGAANGHVAEATVATAGVSVADHLVHTHHLIAEATLRGLIRPGDAVRVTHRPEVDAGPHLDPARAGVVQTRITRDGRDPGRLRLYALLVSERRETQPCRPIAS
jgi:Family of unknown function (DUF6182)